MMTPEQIKTYWIETVDAGVVTRDEAQLLKQLPFELANKLVESHRAMLALKKKQLAQKVTFGAVQHEEPATISEPINPAHIHVEPEVVLDDEDDEYSTFKI